MMSASCGPALRYSLANMAKIKNSVRIARPAMTTAFCVRSIQGVLLSTPETCVQVAGQLVERPDVGDALFVARDHNFCAFRNRGTAFGARAGDAACARLGVDELAGAARTDRDAEPAEHADQFVIA